MEHSGNAIKFADEREIAALLGVSIGTLRRWRGERIGPKFLKLQRAVRYPMRDFIAWLESRPTGGEEGTI
jgi:predicted DNA-binding transcriptional regulator AlpA